MTWTLPKTIAVVGGGPCGAGFAKALIAEGKFEKIKIFEKRSDFGGLWNYTKEEDVDSIPIPCDTPNVDTKPVFREELKDYVWASPVYDHLDTNVPKDVMSYSSMPFDDNLPLFPHRSDVDKYMKEYAEPLRSYTSFSTKIIKVKRNDSNTKWVVQSRPISIETQGGTVSSEKDGFQDLLEEFDGVVLATGNYELPYVPNIEGLKSWSTTFPGSVVNVKNYRSPAQFKDIKGHILVVGNSASANDLCYQLVQANGGFVYKSKRSENVMPAGSSPKILDVPEIKKFDTELKRIDFVDGSHLENVEKIVFATGYLHSYPFLDATNDYDIPLITNGHRLHGTYEHVLLYNYPNLAVAGAARYILPTRTSESQGSWTAKVWSGSIPHPSRESMVTWELARSEETGGGKTFHDLYFPEDVHYANRLNAEILKVNTGLIPFIWDKEQVSIRGAIKEVKEGYIRYRAATGKLAKSYQEIVESGHLNSFMLTDEQMKEKGF
ncbi:thiol-specific monooxygenase [[Candida] railenensis]|uniref:Thiol-specific monooxygenase n=1 Tax=[Candida] railenensis TaxID=45579 RepID=A0A9P0QN58_9ASCO|nr:thiol-specific monooxygenase [[Candida] railenensis]